MQKIGNWQEQIDFSESCQLGQDTMLARLLTILKYFNLNTNISYEVPQNANRVLKVQESSNYNIATPKIILQGKWLEKFGFPVGSQISVECFQNKRIKFSACLSSVKFAYSITFIHN